MEDKDRIIGKIIIEATLSNASPLIVGSGSDEMIDKEIIRQPDGNPYIPASSVAGKLRRIFKINERCFDATSFEQFWGTEDSNAKNTFQSHIAFDDLLLLDEKERIAVRDGVRINHKTNLADNKSKYNYEVLEPNHRFGFRAEVTIRKNFKADEFIVLSDYLLQVLATDFQIGANSTSGFGELSCSDSKIYYFDFPTDFEAWMEYLDGKKPDEYKMPKDKQIKYEKPKNFKIEAFLNVKSTFLTSSYNIEGDSDKTQLSRNYGNGKEFVVGGKSIRGAFRHRGLKILNTLGIADAQERIKDLFGDVDEDSKEAYKSRVSVKEGVFEGGNTEKQTRIKIDRFTGGTIEGALLEVESLVKGKIKLNFEIHHSKKVDVALIMFILKDLWTSDLAIGGEKSVGRGVLVGESATINWAGETLRLNKHGVEGTLPEKFKNLTLN